MVRNTVVLAVHLNWNSHDIRPPITIRSVDTHEQAVTQIKEWKAAGYKPESIGLKWGAWTGAKFGRQVLQALPHTAWGKGREKMEAEMRELAALILE